MQKGLLRSAIRLHQTIRMQNAVIINSNAFAHHLLQCNSSNLQNERQAETIEDCLAVLQAQQEASAEVIIMILVSHKCTRACLREQGASHIQASCLDAQLHSGQLQQSSGLRFWTKKASLGQILSIALLGAQGDSANAQEHSLPHSRGCCL